MCLPLGDRPQKNGRFPFSVPLKPPNTRYPQNHYIPMLRNSQTGFGGALERPAQPAEKACESAARGCQGSVAATPTLGKCHLEKLFWTSTPQPPLSGQCLGFWTWEKAFDGGRCWDVCGKHNIWHQLSSCSNRTSSNWCRIATLQLSMQVCRALRGYAQKESGGANRSSCSLLFVRLQPKGGPSLKNHICDIPLESLAWLLEKGRCTFCRTGQPCPPPSLCAMDT